MHRRHSAFQTSGLTPTTVRLPQLVTPPPGDHVSQPAAHSAQHFHSPSTRRASTSSPGGVCSVSVALPGVTRRRRDGGRRCSLPRTPPPALAYTSRDRFTSPRPVRGSPRLARTPPRRDSVWGRAMELRVLLDAIHRKTPVGHSGVFTSLRDTRVVLQARTDHLGGDSMKRSVALVRAEAAAVRWSARWMLRRWHDVIERLAAEHRAAEKILPVRATPPPPPSTANRAMLTCCCVV